MVVDSNSNKTGSEIKFTLASGDMHIGLMVHGI